MRFTVEPDIQRLRSFLTFIVSCEMNLEVTGVINGPDIFQPYRHLDQSSLVAKSHPNIKRQAASISSGADPDPRKVAGE